MKKLLAGAFIASTMILPVITPISQVSASSNSNVAYTQTVNSYNTVAYNNVSSGIARAAAYFPDIQGNVHKPAIEFLASQGVVKGYDSGPYAGKFMPNKSVSFAEALAISMRSGDKASRIEATAGGEHWSAPLLRLYNAEDKQTERVYKDHNAPINRDVALYLILRQAGVHFEKETVNAGFSDVKSTSMFAPYIAFAKWAGYTRGYTDGPKAGQFGANEALTRGELSTFTYKILKSDGGTTAVKAKFDEYRAFKWLEKNNGVYSDLASLTSGIGAVYGRESSVTAAAVTLVQSGKFSYKYKTVSSGTTVSTPSVNVGGGNSGGANSGGNTSFTGNGNENVDWGAIYKSEADAATKGIVDTYMKDYNGDKARVERVLRKNFSDEPKALQIYLNYLNSL